MYISALRFRWLTCFYDPVVRWTTEEEKLKRLLVAQARAAAQDQVNVRIERGGECVPDSALLTRGPRGIAVPNMCH